MVSMTVTTPAAPACMTPPPPAGHCGVWLLSREPPCPHCKTPAANRGAADVVVPSSRMFMPDAPPHVSPDPAPPPPPASRWIGTRDTVSPHWLGAPPAPPRHGANPPCPPAVAVPRFPPGAR